jgi:large subunit ribosomal protein L24
MAHKIRKGDLVQVMTGHEDDRGRQGRVLAVDRARGKVRVEKVRMQKRHLKPGRAAARTGGIIEQEGYIDISNVMLVDPSTNKPSRVRIEVDGKTRKRVFAKSGHEVPEPART